MDRWKMLLDLVQTAFGFGLTLWVWASNRRAATKTAVEQRDLHVDRELARLEKEVELAKQRACLAPGNDDFVRVHSRLDSVHGELRHVCGEVGAMRRTLDLLNEHLLTSGASK